MCHHKAGQSSSYLLHSPPAFALTFFLHRKAISCCSVTLTPPPHACSTLSPCRDSFTIVRSRSNPNLQGSLTGAPFNCLVQAAAAEGKMTALKAFAFLFTSSSHCCHSLSTHARIPVLLTAAGSLSSHARLIYPSLSYVIQIDSLHFKKKKDR